MNQNLKNSIYGIILLGGGLYLGRMIGMTQTYMDTGKALTFSYFNGASTNLNTHITLLNLMHARDYEKVSGKLENLVDVDLIALSGYSAPPAPLKDDVLRAIEKAKEYRKKHPRPDTTPETVKATEKAFNLVK
jgi:hypothetical protein